MARYFIFLEILDPEINALLSEISKIVLDKKPERAPHLTVRGPYSEGIPVSTLAWCRKIMKHDVLKIGEVGRFSNSSEEVVYLNVDSPNLKEIWWKPKYSMKKHGFHPHLSVYRGTDSLFADKLANLLEKERINLLCAEFCFVSHLRKQLGLFPRDVPMSEHFRRLVISGRVSSNFIKKLEQMVKNYKYRLEKAIKEK